MMCWLSDLCRESGVIPERFDLSSLDKTFEDQDSKKEWCLLLRLYGLKNSLKIK